MEILQPFPTDLVTILIKAGPVAKEMVNGEEFDVVPYEDPQKLGITVGYVKVAKYEEDGVWRSNLKENVYQATATERTTAGTNDLVAVEPVEWHRNQFT